MRGSGGLRLALLVLLFSAVSSYSSSSSSLVSPSGRSRYPPGQYLVPRGVSPAVGPFYPELRPRRQGQPLRSSQQADLVRRRRQIFDIYRLYTNYVRENQDDRAQAGARIREIVDRLFNPPNATSPARTAESQVAGEEGGGSGDGETETPKPPPMLNRDMLLANLRRNLRGLGRLFMRELRSALSQSKQNVKSFGSDLWGSIRPQLAVNLG